MGGGRHPITGSPDGGTGHPPDATLYAPRGEAGEGPSPVTSGGDILQKKPRHQPLWPRPERRCCPHGVRVAGRAGELPRHPGSRAPCPGTHAGSQAGLSPCAGPGRAAGAPAPAGQSCREDEESQGSPGGQGCGLGLRCSPSARSCSLERETGAQRGRCTRVEAGPRVHGPPSREPPTRAPRSGRRGGTRPRGQGEAKGGGKGNSLPDHLVEALPVLGGGVLLTGRREQSAGHRLVIKLLPKNRCRSPPRCSGNGNRAESTGTGSQERALMASSSPLC